MERFLSLRKDLSVICLHVGGFSLSSLLHTIPAVGFPELEPRFNVLSCSLRFSSLYPVLYSVHSQSLLCLIDWKGLEEGGNKEKACGRCIIRTLRHSTLVGCGLRLMCVSRRNRESLYLNTTGNVTIVKPIIVLLPCAAQHTARTIHCTQHPTEQPLKAGECHLFSLSLGAKTQSHRHNSLHFRSNSYQSCLS